MKKCGWLLLLLLPLVLKAQVITTVVGTFGGAVYDPQQLAFDIYGNLYIPTGLGNKILKIDTSGVVSTFAGTGVAGYAGDSGLAISAEFKGPIGIATDTLGNVYVADAGNNRIRKIDAITGVITTIAGNGVAGYGGDSGPANVAMLFSPKGLFLDRFGNFYITDVSNYRVRKIDTSGIITTVAGNGIMGSTGDGGLATSAACAVGYGLCTDVHGNLFIIDQLTSTIRKVDTSGIISTIAGNSGSYTYNGDGISALGAGIGPVALIFDANEELVISDNANYRIRKIDNLGIIHTIVGNGTYGYSGDNGLADSAELKGPSGIAFDHCGNLFIAQVNSPCIRKVSFNPACWAANVQNVTNSHSVNVYPNPAYNELTITATEKINNVSIYNLIGQAIYNQQYNTEKIELNIASFPAGVYMVSITDNEGNKTVKKFVKE